MPCFRTDSYLKRDAVAGAVRGLHCAQRAGRSGNINRHICCFKEQTGKQVEGNLLLLVPRSARAGAASITATQTVRTDLSGLMVKV